MDNIMSISFSNHFENDQNSGIQVGINNGTIKIGISVAYSLKESILILSSFCGSRLS